MVEDIEDIVKNRKLNYTIIKLLWSINEKHKGMVEFYQTMDISRNRYARILNLDDTVKLDKVTATLKKKTSVDADIFMGYKRINVNGISDAEVDKYLEDADSINNKDLSEKEIKLLMYEQKKFENSILAKLKLTSFVDNVDFNLYKLYTYFKKGYPFTGDKEDAILMRLTNSMNELTFKRLENAGKESFDEYVKALENQYTMAKALSNYRKYK